MIATLYFKGAIIIGGAIAATAAYVFLNHELSKVPLPSLKGTPKLPPNTPVAGHQDSATTSTLATPADDKAFKDVASSAATSGLEAIAETLPGGAIIPIGEALWEAW